MNKIIKVAGTSYIGRSGKLINRKAYRKILNIKIPLSQAKDRVRKLKTSLEKVRELTLNDPEKVEYGITLNKLRKENRRIPITRGYIEKFNDTTAHAINLPVPKNVKRNWIVHSHPTTRPLSIQDILSTKRKGGTVFASVTDGSSYRATRLTNDNNELKNIYDAAKKKVLNSESVKDYMTLAPIYKPDLDATTLKHDIQTVVQHRLLKHLDKKGLIRYRPKLTEEARKRINEYKDIMNIELKRNTNAIIFLSDIERGSGRLCLI